MHIIRVRCSHVKRAFRKQQFANVEKMNLDRIFGKSIRKSLSFAIDETGKSPVQRNAQGDRGLALQNDHGPFSAANNKVLSVLRDEIPLLRRGELPELPGTIRPCPV